MSGEVGRVEGGEVLRVERAVGNNKSNDMTISLSGKVALVTGGSKGIGAGAALALSEARAKVAICARNADELRQTAADIEARTGHRVVAIPADVSLQADVDRLVQEVEAALGGIDILVNNAGGVGQIGPFEEIPADLYTTLYEANVVSMVRMAKAVLPVMKAKKWGRIINISSENGLQPDPDMTPYNLTKAAIINFSKSLSKSVGGHNILVNTVSPAFIYTPLVKEMLEGIAARDQLSPQEAMRRFLAEKRPNIELKRAGGIEEVGAAIVFLASDSASFITGTNLRVDGGSVASI
jgi:3-oxoacyl-[acyl-carrier protein] reductase